MTKQQPACPAEYAEMQRNRLVRFKNGRRMLIVEGPRLIGPIWRVRTEDNKWRMCADLVVVSTGKMTELETLRAENARLEAENERLKRVVGNVKGAMNEQGSILNRIVSLVLTDSRVGTYLYAAELKAFINTITQALALLNNETEKEDV